MYVLIYLLSPLLAAFSQILLKKSANKSHQGFIEDYINPLVISAYIIFFICTIITLVSLKYIDLSTAVLLESSSYIYVLLFSRLIFAEKIKKSNYWGFF